ncbi:hypothetical protein COT51_00585 [candidate division WWE3 bacterium CG08_land_8_20_14_0_20_41_15]|uniref:Fido domain-containing protein n=1 Tax=candidate division WWE3 bacterium CG08_land_8_20_14_0_20_41_15 TaxID=1975086 RepID=A0A2H0XCK9_UNCKA|nr:MAG: hypothetical protein COT51_00585 [candidate division WWE3 bacterium CG08_land_8_20_14_0_20_41_15]
MEYTYKQTEKIKKLLQEIAILQALIERLPKVAAIEENLRRQSLLGSAVYSARIEGNPLTIKGVSIEGNGKGRARLEIRNIIKALIYVRSSRSPKIISKILVLRLHKIVMANLSIFAGKFRSESEAVFDQFGNVLHFAPPPLVALKRLNDLILFIGNSKEATPIKAAIFHFAFEKIHPFQDGNGRVGRLLSSFILDRGGFGFRGLVSLEKYVGEHRETYYDLLSNEGRDITNFVEFFLEGITTQSQKAVEDLQKVEISPSIGLLPRRKEIFELIKDHRSVTFDEIYRRFLNVPKSTLHNDLSALQKASLIRKLGTTRGVVYEIT